MSSLQEKFIKNSKKAPDRPFTRHPDEIKIDISNEKGHDETDENYLEFLKWELKATIWIKHVEKQNSYLGTMFLEAMANDKK